MYDAFNLGNGYENIYTAIPGADGGPDTVTDTLMTPNGDVNLDSLFGGFDAAAPLNPGDAFTGFEVGDISGAADAFSIGGFTLDPTLAAGGEGFDTDPRTRRLSPPLLEIGGGTLQAHPLRFPKLRRLQRHWLCAQPKSERSTTGEDVTDLLGFTNTRTRRHRAPRGDRR